MAKDNLTAKDLIKRGFLELMTQKSYIDITVTDIVNAAGVARVSFYRNYSSINDIIDDLIDELASEFLEAVYPVVTGHDERQWRELLFKFFYRFPKQFALVRPCNLQNAGVLFSRINTRVQLLGKRRPCDTIQDKYAVFGKMGLITNIIKKWVDEGMQETPEEMVDYIMSFILLF